MYDWVKALFVFLCVVVVMFVVYFWIYPGMMGKNNKVDGNVSIANLKEYAMENKKIINKKS